MNREKLERERRSDTLVRQSSYLDVVDDTVNLLFTICANESAPIALTYFHRFRQRFSTVFGYSVPLLSRGRSFSR